MTKLSKRWTTIAAGVALGLAILAPTVRSEEPMVLLTGPEDGTYNFIGTTIRGVSSDPRGLRIIPTPGSFENLVEMATGQADFAFLQLDMLAAASRMQIGKHLLEDVRVVLPLYREEVHILVRKSAGIRSVGGLLSRRVAVGSMGSGSYYSAQQFLAAFAIDVRTGIDPSFASPAEAVADLAAGRVDAVFLTGGGPLKVVADLPPEASEQVEFLSLPPQDVSRIMDTSPGYELATIPAGTYSFQSSEVSALATHAVLVTRGSSSEEVVERLLSDIFTHQGTLAAGHPKWREVSLDRAVQMREIFKDRIVYHPGTEKFLPPRQMKARVHVLVSGVEGGTYHLFGEGISRLARSRGVGIRSVESAGSLRNLFAVAFGRADFGLVQLDVIENLREKEYGDLLTRFLRVVTPLYQEEVHVLVRKGAGIESLADLAGKRVHIGGAGSGSRWSAAALLGEGGLNGGSIQPRMGDLGQALRDLQADGLDAVIFTGGYPVDMFRLLSGDGSNEIELLSLTETESQEAHGRSSAYRATTIPANTYPWQGGESATVATPCVLVCHTGVDKETVEALLEALHQGDGVVSTEHSKWGNLSEKWSRDLLGQTGIPVHPGAQAYYEGE